MKYLIFDLETIQNKEVNWHPPEDRPDAFPPIPAHEIISTGVMTLDIKEPIVSSPSSADVLYFGNLGTPDDEFAMLNEFLEMLDEHFPDLVSYNGRGFDLPVIEHRCMRYGLQCPQLFEWNLRNRFKEQGHIDLQDVLTNFGASMRSKLNIICKAIGMPGKMDVDGSNVAELIAAGKQQQVDSYCLCDVAETAWLLVRWLHMKGTIDRRANHEAVHAIKNACIQANDEMLTALVEQTNIERLSLEEQMGEMPVEDLSDNDEDPEIPF